MSLLPTSPLLHLALLLNRVAVGLFLIVTGVGKLIGEFQNGFGSFYHSDTFQQMLPYWLTDPYIPAQWIAIPFGYALPWAETILGGLLLIGLLGRVAAGLLALLLLGILIAHGVNHQLFMWQGEYQNPSLYRKDIIIFTLEVLLTVTGPGLYSIDGPFRERRRRKKAEQQG